MSSFVSSVAKERSLATTLAAAQGDTPAVGPSSGDALIPPRRSRQASSPSSPARALTPPRPARPIALVWQPGAPGYMQHGPVCVALGSGEATQALWICGDAMAAASSLFEGMLTGCSRQETEALEMPSIVTPDTWRRLFDVCHNEAPCEPELDDAIALHAAIAFLDPTQRHQGKALASIAGRCLALIKAADSPQLVRLFEEARSLRDPTTLDLTVARLLELGKFEREGEALSLSLEALEDLLFTRSAEQRPAASLRLTAAWLEQNRPPDDSGADWPARARLRAAFPWHRCPVFLLRRYGLPAGLVQTHEMRTAPVLKALGVERTLPSRGYVGSRCVAMGGDKVIVSAGPVPADAILPNEWSVKVWDRESGRCLRSIGVETLHISNLVIYGDLVVAGLQEGLRAWDLVSGEERRHWPKGWRPCVAVENDALVIATGETIEIWDRSLTRPLQTLCGLFFSGTNAIKGVAARGDVIVTTEIRGDIRRWDRGSGKCVKLSSRYRVQAVTLLGDVIVGGCRNGTIEIWDSSSIEPVRTLHGHEGWITSVEAFDEVIVSRGEDGTIKVWDPAVDVCLQTLTAPGHGFTCVAAGDGTIVGGAKDGRITVWTETAAAETGNGALRKQAAPAAYAPPFTNEDGRL
jgi:hypothetical protein